jgi:hypothetical protein
MMDEQIIGVKPSGAAAILGRELRSYATLVRSDLPGRGRKRATLRRLGRLAGREDLIESAVTQLDRRTPTR